MIRARGTGIRSLIRLCAVVAVLGAQPAGAEERHHHDGVFPALEGSPPEISLSVSDLSDLADGATLIRSVRGDADNHAVAVLRVDASPAVIWSVLLDFDQYPRWVDGLVSTEIYEQDGDDYYVSFHYRQWLVGDLKYHIRHTYPGQVRGWGTWTLDYRRRSDLDDIVGFWRVRPVSGEPNQAIVMYSTRFRIDGWLDAIVGDWLIENTLRNVSHGLKARVEQAKERS